MALIKRVTTTISGTYVNGGGLQTFHFAGGTGTAAQLCAAVGDFWNYNASVFVTGTSFVVEPEVLHIDDASGDLLAVTAGSTTTITGSAVSEPLSPATQGLIRWRTGVVEDSREIRGRTFLPAMCAADNDDGKPIAAALTVFNTMASNLIANANSELVIWRRPRKARPQVGSPGDPWFLPAQSQRDGSSATVTSSSAWTKWSVLRSRRD
jgi:hypothetical protein